MTDEERAEKWIQKHSVMKAVPVKDGFRFSDYKAVRSEPSAKDAFLAGLKVGRPKWHKVADGDLPEAENYFWSRTVLLQTNKDSSIIGFYDHASKAWYEKETDDMVYGVIEWCEIPKYTEE